MLDRDLAFLFGTETKKLKQAVRRNIDRFPEDFMFETTRNEIQFLRSQFVTLETHGQGNHSKYLPYVFTEHGILMLGNVLRSKVAIHMSIEIIRIFSQMREFLRTHQDLSQKLMTLEGRLDTTDESLRELRFELKKLLEVDRDDASAPKISFELPHEK